MNRWLTLGSFAGMVLLAAGGLVPILTAILLACSVLIVTRTISFGRAIDALDLDILLIVAAAAPMVPIAIDVAQRVDAEPIGFAVAVALAASASFLTAIGYQTNTIVHGLGGYRFGDYWRLGLPWPRSR